MYQYLTAKGYTFLFLKFCDGLSRTNNFDITPYLPKNIQQTYKRMFPDITDLHKWAGKYDLLDDDDFHPTRHGHLDWTRKVLHPYLVDNTVL